MTRSYSRTVLAVGEYYDGAMILRIGNGEVSEGIIGSPVPQHLAMLISLDPPAETPEECAVETHHRSRQRAAVGRRQIETVAIRPGHYSAQKFDVIPDRGRDGLIASLMSHHETTRELCGEEDYSPYGGWENAFRLYPRTPL
jgi:hypothetical protein